MNPSTFTSRVRFNVNVAKRLQAIVDTRKEYSRDQLNSKFESSMSRKSRREHFKPLSDEDIKDVKYVDIYYRRLSS